MKAAIPLQTKEAGQPSRVPDRLASRVRAGLGAETPLIFTEPLESEVWCIFYDVNVITWEAGMLKTCC